MNIAMRHIFSLVHSARRFLMNTTRSALAAAALLAIGVPAFAADASTVVRFGDLNLASAKGARVLAQRIHEAADSVCGPSLAHLDLAAENNRRVCVANTEAAAHRQLQAQIALLQKTGSAIASR
jgi:UrcA family protein